MTVAERPRTRRPLPCTRCGLFPRYDETYICAGCSADPSTRNEREMAEAEHPGNVWAQRYAVQRLFGWKGGWSRNERGAHS
jgi:hypothetical protein